MIRTPVPRIVKHTNTGFRSPVRPRIPYLGSFAGGVTCSPKTRIASTWSNTDSASSWVIWCFLTFFVKFPRSQSKANAVWFSIQSTIHWTNRRSPSKIDYTIFHYITRVRPACRIQFYKLLDCLRFDFWWSRSGVLRAVLRSAAS